MVREIPLSQAQVGLVDDADFEWVSQFKWCVHRASHTNYVKRKARSIGQVMLHRLIAGAASGELVDHINGNGLDNRRCNLRIVNYQQNAMNRARKQNARSQFKGVKFDRGHWRAVIKVDGTYIRRRCTSEEDAARLYDELAIQHFGAFARTNFGRD
jgi:hypothetical protein